MATDAHGKFHRKRFIKWQNLAPTQTRFLSAAVDTQLVPSLEAVGFLRVDVCLGNPEWPVSGGEIELERVRDELIDSVSFRFEKYKAPRFQVHFSRRQVAQPHYFVRSGNLVAHSQQYYHFWGKPWWLPTRFWPDKASLRTIDTIRDRAEQIPQFLEAGTLGPNISRHDLDTGKNAMLRAAVSTQ
jgi:hypothetical protein